MASLLFIAVCALWQPVGGFAWHVTGAGRWGLHAVQFFGVVLIAKSAAVLDVFELAGVRQSGVMEARPSIDEFRKTGPYGWVRHPIYTGWILLVVAAPAMTMTRLVFAAVSTLYLLIAMPLEERSLQAASSGAYRRYMLDVQWRLIPGVF
jgi:protein-S-isoprenylcysteine O-methyltransferase Ste14